MVLTTKSIPQVSGKASEKKEPSPSEKPAFQKPVLPEEIPARLTVIQKYKRGPDNKPVPLDHVYVTFNQIGSGRGGRFKVPRVWLETLWKSLK